MTTTKFDVARFVRIFDPSPADDERWYINDHCFIREPNGQWHLFGITHAEPLNPRDEKFFAHATAPSLLGPWRGHEPVMHTDPAAGETHVWAPHVIRHDGQYWMFYCAGGDSHERYRIHLATSPDLWTWQRSPHNPMVVDGYHARDPMILRLANEWRMYYCATSTPSGGHHVVYSVSSQDLLHWSDRREVFRSERTGTYGGPTESPYVIARNGRFYLFVCTNKPYRHSVVYESDTPDHWEASGLIGEFKSHAAEHVVDEDGREFLSHAGWGQGGVYLAALTWRDA